MLIRGLKAFHDVLSETLLNLIPNLLELLKANGFVRAHNTGESGVSLAVSFPYLLFVPLIYQSEKLKEKYSQIVTFCGSTTMNTWQYAF